MCLNWFFGLLLWIKHILQFFEEANVYKHSSTDAQNGAEKLELYNEKKKKKKITEKKLRCQENNIQYVKKIKPTGKTSLLPAHTLIFWVPFLIYTLYFLLPI